MQRQSVHQRICVKISFAVFVVVFGKQSQRDLLNEQIFPVGNFVVKIEFRRKAIFGSGFFNKIRREKHSEMIEAVRLAPMISP